MDATGGGHGGVLAIPAHAGRKEWRVVSEGSGKDRVLGENLNDHGRANGTSRVRVNSGPLRQNSNSRNGRMFLSGSNCISNDSDLNTTDIGRSHAMATSVSPEDLTRCLDRDEGGTMYEEIQRVQQQEEHLDSALNSLSVDCSQENRDEVLQQRLHEIIRQREQLQNMEVELKAQFIARVEISRLQSGFDEKAKQHAAIVANLQEQAQDRGHRIHDLEQQLEERERQLHANQLEANEAVSQVWAKDDLLREQNNDIANLRRERDNAVAEHKAAVAQFEAESAQHLAQLELLKEQVREKECQMQEMEEQHRNTQDALMYKDEQLRNAQAWMQRAQEMDAFHTNANTSLHAELRERIDQMNQLWLGYQRQSADAERYHAQTVQKLQLEIADLREQNRLLQGITSAEKIISKDERVPHQDNNVVGHGNDHSVASVSKVMASGISMNSHVKSVPYLNGTIDGARSFALQHEVSPKVESATGLPVRPNAALGMAHILPSGPAAAIPQFGSQQQGVLPSLHPVPVQIAQVPLSQFQPVQAVIQTQYLSGAQHQQAIQHHPKQLQHQPSQGQRFPQRQQHYTNYQSTIKAQGCLQSKPAEQHNQLQAQNDQEQLGLEQAGATRSQLIMHFSQHSESSLVEPSDNQRPVNQLHNVDGHELVSEQQTHVEESLQPQSTPSQLLHQQEAVQEQEVSYQDHHEQHGQSGQQLQQFQQLFLQSGDQMHLVDEHNPLQSVSQQQSKDVQVLQGEGHLESQPFQLVSSSSGEQISAGLQAGAPLAVSSHESSGHFNTGIHSSKQTPYGKDLQNSVVQSIQQSGAVDGGGKGTEPMLLDERSLLGCLIRVIPAESSMRIRISTTLPNRLGKMLAPLHWHDYKKQYGRLDEFVNSHSELFVIEGDFIHLREGAHALVSASTAVAKAAAAVAAASPIGSTWLPAIALTPVAQSHAHRLRGSKGVIMPQKDTKQQQGLPAVLNNAHSTNSQHTNLFSQQQGSGGLQVKQGPTAGSAGDERTHQNQLVNATLNGDANINGQSSVTALGLGPSGMVPNVNGTNGGELEKAMPNGFGGSGVANGRSGSYYGNRQPGRSAILASGSFGNQDFILRPQIQESRASSSAAAIH
eukprot:c29279_g1_i1 orf=728-4054(-)